MQDQYFFYYDELLNVLSNISGEDPIELEGLLGVASQEQSLLQRKQAVLN